MKIQRQKNATKKKIAIISTLLALVALAAGAYLLLCNNSNEIKPTTPADTAIETEEVSTDPIDKTTAPNTDTPPPIHKDENTNKSVAEMTVSANIVNSTAYVRGGVNNAVVKDGVCYAQLSNGEQTIRKETTLLQNPSNTDCKTIAINLSELSKGVWLIQLHYTSDTMEGSSNEASLEIK